jgi:antitoxin HicB
MKKTVEEYMKLPYTVELTPDEEGFLAKLKELDGCMTVGDTVAEALEMLEDAKCEWFIAALEDDFNIPLPESMREAKHSGKFALRMSATLHKKLAEGAEQERVSLNQYIVILLSERNPLADLKRMLIAKKVSSEPVAQPEIEPCDWAVTNTGPSCKVLPFERRKPQVIGL